MKKYNKKPATKEQLKETNETLFNLEELEVSRRAKLNKDWGDGNKIKSTSSSKKKTLENVKQRENLKNQKRNQKNLETTIQRKNSEKEKICENVKYLRTQGNPITSWGSKQKIALQNYRNYRTKNWLNSSQQGKNKPPKKKQIKKSAIHKKQNTKSNKKTAKMKFKRSRKYQTNSNRREEKRTSKTDDH